VGADADLMVVDLDRRVRVTAGRLQSHADYSPYEGFLSQGWPVITVAGGEVIQEDGAVSPTRRRGNYLRRTTVPSPRLP
jgi:dihydroorotase-like cyclic amidohydrolase